MKQSKTYMVTQTDKLLYVIVNKPDLEQREGIVIVSIRSKTVSLSMVN